MRISKTAKMLVDWQAKEKDPVKRQQIIDAMGSHRSVEGVRLIFLALTAVLEKELAEPETELGSAARSSLIRLIPVLKEAILTGNKWNREVKDDYMLLWQFRPDEAEEALEKWTRKNGIKQSSIKDRPHQRRR